MCFMKFIDSVITRNKPQFDDNTYDFFSICEEIGETFSSLRKNMFHSKPVPTNYDLQLLDECGDLFWFITRALLVRTESCYWKELANKIDELYHLANMIEVKEKSLRLYMKELAVCFTSYFRSITGTNDYPQISFFHLEDKFSNLVFNLIMILRYYRIDFYDCLIFNIEKLDKRHNGKRYDEKYYRGE